MFPMPESPSPEQLASNFKKLYAFEFLSNLHFISGVLVVFFTSWGKISFAQIMLLQSCYVIFGFLLEVPTGVLADLLGRKLSLAAGALALVLAVLLYSAYPNFWIFLAAEFLWAVTDAFISGADQALIYDSLKALGRTDDSQKVFARYQNARLTALLIAAPLGSLIAAHFGLRFTMLLLALPALLAFLLSFRLYEPPRDKTPGARFHPAHFLRTMKVGVFALMRDATLRTLSIDRILVTALAFLLIWMYQPMLEKLHVPLSWFGVVSAALTGVQMLIIARLAALERFAGSPKAFLIGSSVICGLAYILLSTQPNVYLSIGLMMLVWGFGVSRLVPYQGHINRHVGSAHRATVLSSISMVDKLFRALVYPLAGWLLERSSSALLMGLGTAILVTALVAARRIKNEDLQAVAAS